MATSVLLLEDDPSIRDLLAEVLNEDGVDVRGCDSPEQITALAGGLADPLAIVDFWGESHAELSSAERERVERLAAAIPTIMVTGRSWANHYTAADLGLLALIPKPFDIDELRQLVGSWPAQVVADSAAVKAQACDLRAPLDGARDRPKASCEGTQQAARHCARCEALSVKLYRVPALARTGSHPPEVLCHFCFLRIVKRRPKRAELLLSGNALS